MAGKDKASGVKSAYEAALEKLDAQGIERPSSETFSGQVKAEIGEIRRRAEASLAELEILHRDSLRKAQSLAAREQEEEDYLRERRRIEDDRDRKIARAKN
jgi:hypothetical protein